MEKLIHDLSEVVGHKGIIQYLQKRVETDTVPQVLLLTGATGLGKTSVAKVLACEVAYATSGKVAVEEAKKRVIDDKLDTPEIKIFNVSTLKNDSEVQSVKENLNIGFSTTGRKVVIVDEAHGMDERQQDSLLVALETLPIGVWVFIVTTDTSGFRDALLGRCKWTLNFYSLSDANIKKLIQDFIEENDLKFEMPTPTLISHVAMYTGNEPRRALNLLGNFPPSSLVKTRDLEAFMNVDECEQVVQLIKYLHGPVVPGIEYIAQLTIDNTFQKTLVEVARCALGGLSPRVSRDTLLFLRQTVEDYGKRPILGFVAEVTSAQKFNKTVLTGIFIKWNVDSGSLLMGNITPQKYDVDRVTRQDLSVMRTSLQEDEGVVVRNTGVQPVQSLASLFEQGEEME